MYQLLAVNQTSPSSNTASCESRRLRLCRMIIFAVVGLVAVSLRMTDSKAYSAEAAKRPNVIVIMADDK